MIKHSPSFRLVLLASLLLLLVACNMPESQTAQPDSAAETSVAATIAAQVTQALLKTATPMPSATTEPASPTPTASPSITPTFSAPMLEIKENTNCRSGPGESYQVITVLRAGQTFELAGRAQGGNYWLVKLPGQSAPCWAWGEFATASGSTHTLPEATPPPTLTAAPPAAPRGLNYAFSCSFTDVRVDLSWTDVATDESGYRILRNGESIVELPANSTFYTDVAPASSGSTLSYAVEAFNSAGKSTAISISFSCP
jgi:hypothetical protein